MYVEAADIRKEYPDFTLEASLSLERGEILSLVGPSGCGKTTLLRLIARLEETDEGRLVIGGRDVSRERTERMGVGFVFQDHALFPHLRVRDNVAFGLAVRGMPARERRAKADGILKRLGLGAFGSRRIATLSGGERQRVALARTLATDPALVLLDEPLSAVDENQRAGLRDELRMRLKDFGMTAIYVTHDIEEAFVVADSVAVMRSGRIEGRGTPHALWNRPPTAFVAEFLDSGWVIDAERTGPREARTALGDFATTEPIPDGPRLALLVPREAVVAERGAATDATTDRRFSLRCVRRDFVRGSWRCSFAVGAGSVYLDFDRAGAPEPGGTVSFRVDPAACAILPRL